MHRTQRIEGPLGQGKALVHDLKPTVRIIANNHLGLPVETVADAGHLAGGDLIAIDIDIEGAQTSRVMARYMVLATGRSGLCGFALPDFPKAPTGASPPRTSILTR
jgi:hypothetical protein